MTQKHIGLLVVVIVLIAGTYGALIRFGISPSVSYTSPEAQPSGKGVVGVAGVDQDPYDIEIVYTDEGYATTSVTIKQGTRVRFLNASSVEEWPASGIHPTHTLYPEKSDTDCLGSSFDSCRSLAPGEFYDYTFYYIGTWSFHDHLHGYDTGVIIVL